MIEKKQRKKNVAKKYHANLKFNPSILPAGLLFHFRPTSNINAGQKKRCDPAPPNLIVPSHIANQSIPCDSTYCPVGRVLQLL